VAVEEEAIRVQVQRLMMPPSKELIQTRQCHA
jgi:hypothetical protein